MNVDYHVHLEEGPYSANWVGRTASALEFFMEDKAYTYGWMESLMSRLDKRLAEGEYSECWLDLYLERAKQLGIKHVGILDHLYRFHDALDYKSPQH
jgi:histidinol-phosphatase (PHP family)